MQKEIWSTSRLRHIWKVRIGLKWNPCSPAVLINCSLYGFTWVEEVLHIQPGVTDWWWWQNKLLESYFIIKNTLKKKKSNWDKEKELDTPLERQTVYKALKISKCCVSNADHQD